MDALASVAVQVPAVAVLGYVFFKIAALFVKQWAASEAKRTEVIEKAEADRTTTIAKGFADIVGELKSQGAVLAEIHGAVSPFAVAKTRRA